MTDDNAEIVFHCHKCGTRLPKEDFQIEGATAEIDCPDCGAFNDVRIE